MAGGHMIRSPLSCQTTHGCEACSSHNVLSCKKPSDIVMVQCAWSLSVRSWLNSQIFYARSPQRQFLHTYATGIIINFPKGWGSALAFHQKDQMMLVWTGRCQVELGGKHLYLSCAKTLPGHVIDRSPVTSLPRTKVVEPTRDWDVKGT